MLQSEFPHLARANDQDGLIIELVEDVSSNVDGDARDRELAAAQSRLVAGALAARRALWKTVWRIGPMTLRPMAAL